ncbi:MAG: O-antigen ligase family protein [Acidobacteria bacterium]|nr:O-antigen ligase family protein [Acidobacteriota bacterium]
MYGARPPADPNVNLNRIALYLALGSAVGSLVSIAVCHSLLALAFAALLLSGTPMRLPRFWPVLAVLVAWTVLAALLSESPWEARPALRKFYCLLTLLTLCSTLTLEWARRLMIALAAAGTFSAAKGLVQFWQKWEAARAGGQPFYQSYVGDRITGFMSHWMTFGGEMMIVLVVIAAWIFFSGDRQRIVIWWVAAALVFAAILLGFTRSIWPATAVAGLYLMWFWRRWLVVVAPVVMVAGLLLAPPPVSERVRSIWNPDKKLDSNEHREALRAAGYRMIAAHPLFGIGPEHTQREFPRYVPEQYKPIPKEWWYGHLHNIYLDFAAERGIPALLAFLAMIGWALRDYLRRVLTLAPEEHTRRMLLHAAIAGVIAILVGGLLERNLGDSEVLTLFWTLLALGHVALRREEAPHEHAA